MDETKLPDVEVDTARGGSRAVKSPEPPPLIDLKADERRVFDYLCARLRDAGIEHLTAGLPIAIIVRTYYGWLQACAECAQKGRYQTAQSGWASESPWAQDEKRLKMELGQWLPKACLTIPSLTRVRKEAGGDSGQDDLFADLLEAAKRGASPRPRLND